jgi:hypothetical protein
VANKLKVDVSYLFNGNFPALMRDNRLADDLNQAIEVAIRNVSAVHNLNGELKFDINLESDIVNHDFQTGEGRSKTSYELTAFHNITSGPQRDLMKIIPRRENDVSNVIYLLDGDVAFYKPDVDVSLFDLSRSPVEYGFRQLDRTNFIAPGVTLDTLLIELTDQDGHKGVFQVNVPGDIGEGTFPKVSESEPLVFRTPSNLQHKSHEEINSQISFVMNNRTRERKMDSSAIASRIPAGSFVTLRFDITATLDRATGILNLSLMVGCISADMMGITQGRLVGYSVSAYLNQE